MSLTDFHQDKNSKGKKSENEAYDDQSSLPVVGEEAIEKGTKESECEVTAKNDEMEQIKVEYKLLKKYNIALKKNAETQNTVILKMRSILVRSANLQKLALSAGI